MMEMSSTEKRIDDLAAGVGRFENRVGRFEESVERRFDKVDLRFDRVDLRFDRFEDKIDARFARWDKIVTAVGVWIAGGVVSIAGAVVYRVLGF
jgi:hypothetical protein